MKKRKGQALLETALVLPIFILFFCGIIDFGRIIHASSKLNLITQESVRLAGLGKADSEVTQFAYNKTDLENKSTLIVKVNPAYSLRKPGDYVTVQISYEVNYITPLIGFILPSPFKINTSSTIRVE
jgi:Flp pilus assembly protein TadG